MTRNQASQAAYCLLRVVSGFMFLQVGSIKLFGWLGGMNGGTAHFISQMWIAGFLEFFGGSLILLGLFTRPVAFLLSGEMAVAYWQFHAPHGTWPILNRGEPAALFCFIFLFMAAQGGGYWSLDRLIQQRNDKSKKV